MVIAQQGAEVWPENWPAVSLFVRLGTQWRVGGFGRPTGLDYAAVYPLLDRFTQDPDEWALALDDLRTLEAAALEQMALNAQSATPP